VISPERLQLFENSWLRLLERWQVAPVDAFPVYDRLVEAYSGPERHYHNLEHLSEMFRVASRLQDRADDPAAIQLAIWFHDAVYDPRSKENELRSAEWAREALSESKLPEETIRRVESMILATAKHLPASSADTQVLLDADLAILGADPKRYDRYAGDIRKEYAWVDDAAYRAGRAAVLEAFLKREAIYQTERMREMGETPARENLRRELDALRE
jgi:predicted metal-dependent HD superfamily phosphohydrolase